MRPPWRGLGGLPRAHACCLALILLELIAGIVLHRPRETLWERWERGSVEERIHALHALAHRGEGEIDGQLLAGLLGEDDERLRAMIVSAAVSKHGAGEAQGQLMRRLGPATCRLYLILARRPGKSVLHREELAWFLNSLEGTPEPCPVLRRPTDHSDVPSAMRAEE